MRGGTHLVLVCSRSFVLVRLFSFPNSCLGTPVFRNSCFGQRSNPVSTESSIRGGETGVSRKGVPKQEFGNEKQAERHNSAAAAALRDRKLLDARIAAVVCWRARFG